MGQAYDMPTPNIPTLKLSVLRATGDRRWRRLVMDALDTAGSVTGAARLLGIGKGTLQRWIAETPELVVGITLQIGPGNPAFLTKPYMGATK